MYLGILEEESVNTFASYSTFEVGRRGNGERLDREGSVCRLKTKSNDRRPEGDEEYE
jgi:hypothetical protein